MRWVLIVLLMCNGIYFLWQNYLLQNDALAPIPSAQVLAGTDAESLQLLSEKGGASEEVNKTAIVSDSVLPQRPIDAEREVVEPQQVETVAEVEQQAICWLIGPFQEEISAKQVISRLAALDIALHLQTLDIPGKPDYWVHLPPQLSRKAAVKLLRELQAKKIDSFLITEGELADGISLGFFTEKVRAEKILEQRIKQGYGAKIKVVPRTRSEVWAVFDQGEYSKFSDVLWEKMQQGNKGIERRKNYCDSIASAEDFD